MAMTLKDLAGSIGARLEPPDAGELQVNGCAALADAGPDQVSFLTNPRYADQLATTSAAAVIVGDESQAIGKPRLIADDPYFAFRNAVVTLHGWRQQPEPGIHPQAFVDQTASVNDLCTIRPFAYVAPRARLGRRVIVYPNVYIGKDVVIGDDCVLYPNVAIYDHCELGDRVVLHAGCVIGQDGFGYATHQGEHHKIPQTGNVVIEDDVELGAGCSVDRAALGSTRIGRGTKASNGVTIGHGCGIGRYNLLVAQVGLAGSVTTGDHVAIGGQSGVAGHLHIGDRAQVAARSGVMADVPADARVGGNPAVALTEAKRAVLAAQHLPDLARRLKQIERRLDALG